jgi:large subunit ribosomal protein L15e
MSMYKQMKQTFISEYKSRSGPYKSNIIKWNAEAPIMRVVKPTNIARARELGYKAKEGVIVARVRVHGGSKKRKQAGGGRKPSKSGRYFTMRKSSQAIAEERASRKFSNTVALNSYFIGSSGSEKYFEVILLDKNSSVLKSDDQYSGIISQEGRAFRGLTSAGKKHRGIIRKRFGSHKLRQANRVTPKNLKTT